MANIFINPVTQNMYDAQELSGFLETRGFTQVFCENDWITVVKKAYEKILNENSKSTLLDMRCPKAVSLVKKICSDSSVVYPEIEPILIHCAKEISEKYGVSGGVVVATPCKSLAEYGNSLELRNTRFVSWNEFAESQNCTLGKKHLAESPIPPGFFSDIEKNAVSVTGKSGIEKLFSSKMHESFNLVEMLFCKDGCNNGDGVL